MNKNQLKPGYMVKIADGNKYIVCFTNECEMFFSNNEDLIRSIHYEYDLTCKANHAFDVIAVYDIVSKPKNIPNLFDERYRELLWKKENPYVPTTPLNKLAKEFYANAKAHGWYDDNRNFGDVVALCHSELSEALEEYRNGKPNVYFIKDGKEETNLDEWNGEKLEGIATEMIDCLIRILDWCGSEGVDADKITTLKHEYNKSRPYKHGGKRI